MKELIKTDSEVKMMSSIEIAKLCEKLHKNVIRDITVIAEQLYELKKDGSNMSHKQNQQVM